MLTRLVIVLSKREHGARPFVGPTVTQRGFSGINIDFFDRQYPIDFLNRTFRKDLKDPIPPKPVLRLRRLLHPRISSGGILRNQAGRRETGTFHSPGNGTG